MRKVFLALLLLIVLSGCGQVDVLLLGDSFSDELSGNSTRQEQPVLIEVTFPDANLEAVMRETTGKEGAIYTSDLAGITTLTANKRGIVDLSGIEHCINLRDVYLAWNQITDVTPLALLKGARAGEGTNVFTTLHISLAGNQISDIIPLGNLTAPDELTLVLSHNQITDISSLLNLTNMIALYLDFNDVVDISTLGNMANLAILGMWDNKVEDITALANLPNLFSLEMGRNQISDVAPLANLIALRHLGLSYNQIADASPLAGLTADIDLRGNPLQ